MALLNPTSKLIVVLVVFVAFFAFLVGLLVGLPLAVVTLNTTSTKAGSVYGFEAVGGNPGGEFLDASMYVTSWSPSYDSEKIVPKGNIVRHFGTLACLTDYRWRIYTTSNGVSWNELTTSPYAYKPTRSWVTDGAVPLDAPIITLRGLYEGGVKADLEVFIKDLADPTCTVGLDKGWTWAGQDLAYLKSGVGSVRAPAQAQVGDTITVLVDVPYVASEKEPGKGWLLYGYSTAQQKEILRVDPIAQAGTTAYTYTVAPADFVQTSGCTVQNRIEWHLYNELWAKDFAFTTTIDASKFAPSMAITSISGDREVGKPVTIAWNATPNPSTKYPINQIVIAYGFGAPDTEKTLPGTATSYVITPGQGGTLHAEVYAVDSACRPSPSATADIQIREPGQGGAPTPEANLFLFLLPIIAFAVIGILAAVAMPSASPVMRVVIVIVFVLVGVVVGFVLVPEVLLPGG